MSLLCFAGAAYCYKKSKDFAKEQPGAEQITHDATESANTQLGQNTYPLDIPNAITEEPANELNTRYAKFGIKVFSIAGFLSFAWSLFR